MKLIRYERPYGLLRNFFNEDSLPTMKTDVRETEDSYIVEAEMPGVKKENVELICEEGVLIITAKTQEDKTEEKADYVRRERVSGSFARRFALDGIDEENISAKLEDGILSVTLPKKAPEKNEKRIEIE